MYEMEPFERAKSVTDYGEKLFKIEFDEHTWKAKITRGQYEY
jgi:hypothetical protein